MSDKVFQTVRTSSGRRVEGTAMKLGLKAARLLTGSTYAILGWDALRTPGGRTEMAAPTLDALRRIVPLPEDELVVRSNAAVQTIGGVMLAAGILPRLSAVMLAASLVPTTAAGHNFWSIEDPAARKLQRVQFHKNVAMLGGLLFAAFEPRPDSPRRRADSG